MFRLFIQLQLDSDGDGQLSFDEFKVLFDNAEKRRQNAQLDHSSPHHTTDRVGTWLHVMEIRKLQIYVCCSQAPVFYLHYQALGLLKREEKIFWKNLYLTIFQD